MNFSLRAIIRVFIAPKHSLSCKKEVWVSGLRELKTRGGGRRESGAFLLGKNENGIRRIHRFIYYDDLDPHCLDRGYVVFDGAGYSALWEECETTGLTVVADVHTHPGAHFQSESDRCNPMVALTGHIALIVPEFAMRVMLPNEIGIYEYKGDHRWQTYSGKKAMEYFYVGMWG